MSTTWAKELAKFDDKIEKCTLSPTELDEEFDGYNLRGRDARAFTAWSRDWVYFPWEYDGTYGAARACRDPSGPGAGPTPFVGEQWSNNVYLGRAEDPGKKRQYMAVVFAVCEELARDHFIYLDFPAAPYGRFVEEAQADGLETPVNLRVERIRNMGSETNANGVST